MGGSRIYALRRKTAGGMVLALALLLFAGSPDARAGGSEAEGLKIAEAHCSRCHIVSEKDRFKGIGSTPSFMTLVRALKDWEERFQTFYARRPHPVHVRVEGIPPPTKLPSNAYPITMTLEDVEHIVALARAIHKREAAEKR